MRREDPDRDRHDEHVRDDDRHESNRPAAQVAEPSGLARAPEQHDGERAQQEADRHEQEAGPVLAPGADRTCVGDSEAAPSSASMPSTAATAARPPAARRG